MRKLKLQVQVSVDGFIAGPNGELDWAIFDWDDELKQYVTKLTETVDGILLGRKLAEGFIPYWAANPEMEGASVFNNTEKIVFSKTLASSPWENTQVLGGELSEEITRLKMQPGGDLIVYGGASFVSELLRLGQVDELHLFVNPTALGSGLPIFQSLNTRQSLALKQAQAFACGIVVLCYSAT